MGKAKPFDIPKREVWAAFKRVRANQGAAGVDAQSIAEFEVDLSNNLYKLWNRLSCNAESAGRPGCALNRPIWSPVKGSSARVSPIRSAIVVRQRFFWIPAPNTDIISAQHFWTGGPETAVPGCYDAIAMARAAGFRMLVFRMLVMSRIRHAAIVP